MYVNLYMHVAVCCAQSETRVCYKNMCLLTSSHAQKVKIESFHIKISHQNLGEHQLYELRRHWQNICCSNTLSLL